MKSLIAITALAVSFACPVWAHDKTTMNEDNPMFSRCYPHKNLVTCDFERAAMVCEPAEKYNKNWPTFIRENSLPEAAHSGQKIDEDLGPIHFVAFRIDEHYGHIYAYVELEETVCLRAITHFKAGDPA